MTPTFVDTNILAYARDRRAQAKQVVAEGWLSALARRREGRISTQVLIEYYAVATHPQKLDLQAAAAQADCRALQAWEPVAPDSDLLDSAWSVQERHGFSWWDALIVAGSIERILPVEGYWREEMELIHRSAETIAAKLAAWMPAA